MNLLIYLKYVLSTFIVTCALLFVCYGILFAEQQRIPLPRALNAIILVLSICFLGYFESGQVSVVNLSVIDKQQTKQIEKTLPLTYKVYQTLSVPGMVERYLIGRQLCVIGLVYLISQLTSFPKMPPILPSGFEHLLIKTGLPGVMITLTIGQLFPQLLADEYTLRFLNLKGSLLFIQISHFIESFGIFTHCSWITSYVLIHFVFGWKSDNHDDNSDDKNNSYNGDIEFPSKHFMDILDISRSSHNLLWKSQPTPSTPSNISTTTTTTTPTVTENKVYNSSGEEICREEIEMVNPYKSGGFLVSLGTLFIFLISTCLNLIAVFLILYGLAFNNPLLQAPRPVLFLIFCCCVVAEFYLEGSQVAILAIQHRDVTTLGESGSSIVQIHQLVNSEKNGVKRFLVGRQFLIVFSMFTMAAITTYEYYDQSFLPQKYLHPFVVTGFIGVIFGLNTVQLPAQMVAKQYPKRFLNLPGMIYLFRLALIVEQTGLMHFGWMLFYLGKNLFVD